MAQSPRSTAGNLDAALFALQTGNMPGAHRELDAALKRNPQDVEARLLMARLWLKSGDMARGRSELDLVLKQAPRHAPALVLMGQVLDRQGDAKSAHQHFLRALSLNDRLPEVWAQLATVEERLEGLPAAISRLQLARRKLPDNYSIAINLGSALARSGNLAAAREAFEQAVKIDGKHVIGHINLGQVLRDTGESAAAVPHYQRAVELDPGQPNAHIKLGHLLLELGRAREAMDEFRTATRLRFLPGATGDRSPALFQQTTAAKLRHDIEQFRYLQAQNLLDGKADQLIADYETALAGLPAPAPGQRSVDLPPAMLPRLAPSYNRLLHWDAGEALPGPAVNPALDWAAITRDYHDRAPGIGWFDGLLTQEAMTALRCFCLTSTFWTEYRYSNGYVGSFMEGGFCCPLLLQIADELAAAMPSVFAGHPIAKMWAFKYDHQLSGIPIHADFAAVNVNFWITPDSANLDPDSGGLQVWDKEAPLDWDIATYNADDHAIRRFLIDSKAQAINIPHRQNRVVMFNSDLFHETGTLNFREGYENRRINVTMLFGQRHKVGGVG